MTVIAGTSVGIGAQLVNGVALLSAAALFLFIRQLTAAETPAATPAADTQDVEQVESAPEEPAEAAIEEPAALHDESDADEPGVVDTHNDVEREPTSYSI